MTAIDVLRDPALVEEAWRYHREVQTKDYQWISLIPEGTEPLIEPNIYDPSRFDTYLEQLGVVYPTMETDSTRLRGTNNRDAQLRCSRVCHQSSDHGSKVDLLAYVSWST